MQVLVGAIVGTSAVVIDLADPFRGAFRITPSSEQLLVIRQEIEQTLCCQLQPSRRWVLPSESNQN